IKKATVANCHPAHPPIERLMTFNLSHNPHGWQGEVRLRRRAQGALAINRISQRCRPVLLVSPEVLPVFVPIYGRIPSDQDARVGTYTYTVIVTMGFSACDAMNT
ncbi:MAG: spore coat protein U domain-containing protein, partial [Polyangiales bacterium]